MAGLSGSAAFSAAPLAVPSLRQRAGTRTAITVLLLALSVWCVMVWAFLRPASIAGDWNGWRQTDTQTIAINFTRPDSSILRPQISWGGNGPGYVETEFQAYTAAVAVVMRAVGQKEWPGQLISLLAIAAACLVVFAHVSRQFSIPAALLAAVAFLAARPSVHLATVIMPDALALLGYVTAWMFFWRYASGGRTRDLVLYGAIGALAMLTKPTTAHLGISSFLFLALAARARLKDYRVWITWIAMVAVVASYLAYAHNLYAEYGNTFGLLSGEDSKTPKLHHLLMPDVLRGALRNTIGWGLGQIAAVVLLIQAVRRRLTAEQVALALGNAAIVPLALRYMSQDSGNYYFAPGALLAALLIASLADELWEARAAWSRAAVAALLALLVVQGYRNFNLRAFYGTYQDADVSNVLATGGALGSLTRPGELVIVRSVNEAYDVFWQSGRNYHEPRIFYMTGTRGWTLGREQADLALLEDARAKGAGFFVDPLKDGLPAIDTWLGANADLVWSGKDGGRIWKLRPAVRAGT